MLEAKISFQGGKTKYYLWGKRIYDPGPLYIKAQGPSRGEILLRTPNESPKQPKDMAEGDLVLGIPQCP